MAVLTLPSVAFAVPPDAEGHPEPLLERGFDRPGWTSFLVHSDGQTLRLEWGIREPDGTSVFVGFHVFDAQDHLVARMTRANIFARGSYHAWVGSPSPVPLARDGELAPAACGSASCDAPGPWSDWAQLDVPSGLLKVAVFVAGGTGAWRLSLFGGPAAAVDAASVLVGREVVRAEVEEFRGPVRVAVREPVNLAGGWGANDATWALEVSHHFLGQAVASRVSFPTSQAGGPSGSLSHLSYADPTGAEQECLPACRFDRYRGLGAIGAGTYTFRLEGAAVDQGGYVYVAGADLVLPIPPA